MRTVADTLPPPRWPRVSEQERSAAVERQMDSSFDAYLRGALSAEDVRRLDLAVVADPQVLAAMQWHPVVYMQGERVVAVGWTPTEEQGNGA